MTLPSTTLFDTQIKQLADELKIPNFKGTFMSDEVPPFSSQSGNFSAIINLEPHYMQGSHWTAIAKIDSQSFYFDSFAEPPPDRVIKSLKNRKQYLSKTPTIFCNSLVVQQEDSCECGSLCLFVLYYLNRGTSYNNILQFLHARVNKTNVQPLRIHDDLPRMETRIG